MPQVLTRRSEPIRPSSQATSSVTCTGLQTQKLALRLQVITQEAESVTEARSFAVRSHLVLSLSLRQKIDHWDRSEPTWDRSEPALSRSEPATGNRL